MEALPPLHAWVGPVAVAALFVAALLGIRNQTRRAKGMGGDSPPSEAPAAWPVVLQRLPAPNPEMLVGVRPVVFLAATAPRRAPPTVQHRQRPRTRIPERRPPGSLS